MEPHNIMHSSVDVESSDVEIDIRVVDSVIIQQNEQQRREKDFSFVDITPYSMNPISDNLFIEVMRTETTRVVLRELIPPKGKSDTATLRVIRGVVKKYRRQIFFLRINGKEIIYSAARNEMQSKREKLHRERLW
jgi:hypothetical protein